MGMVRILTHSLVGKMNETSTQKMLAVILFCAPLYFFLYFFSDLYKGYAVCAKLLYLCLTL